MFETGSHAPGISLRELLPGAQFFGAHDIRTSSCSGDSRNVRAGDLFVAIMGAYRDGHDYVSQAILRGAKAVLAERPLPICGLPVCVVSDTRAAYGVLCQALAGNPSRQVRVIGVTGTNGKTSTTALIAGVLRAAGQRVGTLGTLGYCDSVESAPATLTTPAAPCLATWLSRMQSAGCSHAVIEVSSHALSQSRVAGIQFDAACVTNVRRDHLDYHGTLFNYRQAKARLFEHLATDAVTILNADDPVSSVYLNAAPGPVLTIALRGSGEVMASVIERLPSEQTFLLTAGSATVPVRTPTIGDAHVYNCLMAAALGLAYGIDLTTIARGLESVGQVAGRLERIECGQPFNVYVDYAHTPDALSGSLDTLREVSAGQVICVFGAGGDRDHGKRPLMGRAVEQRADRAIITTDNPRGEDPALIARAVLSGFEYPSRVSVVLDRAQAIHLALQSARAGDCVLVAGKGHEDYQVVGGRRIAFDDAQVARRWLYNLVPESEWYSVSPTSYKLSNS